MVINSASSQTLQIYVLLQITAEAFLGDTKPNVYAADPDLAPNVDLTVDMFTDGNGHSFRRIMGRPRRSISKISPMPVAPPSGTSRYDSKKAKAIVPMSRSFTMLLKTFEHRRWLLWIPLALSLVACGKSKAEKEAEAQKAVYLEKYAKAKALFEERCKTAGVVINRTVKDVEGIELTKIRQRIPWSGPEYFDPMFPGAAMASESSGDGYVWQFLQSEFRYAYAPEQRGSLGPPDSPIGYQQLPPTRGYRYVEYFNLDGKHWQRCEANQSTKRPIGSNELMTCSQVAQPSSRYALDFEDLVDAADRELWISGTKLKIVDKKTNEIIAELTKYVWDPGFGIGATGRLPWLHAGTAVSTVCPKYPDRLHGWDSRYFIDAVLQPAQGE